jgi:hypothetical protein
MIKLCILFRQQEISLTLRYEPTITFDANNKITGMQLHPDDVDSTLFYLRYIDWERVEAVVQYNEDAPTGTENESYGKEGTDNGKETG